jgi:hypothetical protein
VQENGDTRPLLAYGIITIAFNTALAAWLTAGNLAGRLPERIGTGDLVLLGVASHKLSRVVARDKPTAALRRPFAEYEGPSGHGEVDEKPRGTGMRRAVGDLVTCPFCMDAWIGNAFVSALLFAPRATRAAASVFTVMAISDFLQLAYKATEKRV